MESSSSSLASPEINDDTKPIKTSYSPLNSAQKQRKATREKMRREQIAQLYADLAIKLFEDAGKPRPVNIKQIHRVHILRAAVLRLQHFTSNGTLGDSVIAFTNFNDQNLKLAEKLFSRSEDVQRQRKCFKEKCRRDKVKLLLNAAAILLNIRDETDPVKILQTVIEVMSTIRC